MAKKRGKRKKTFSVKGIDEEISYFDALNKDTTEISSKIVYSGMGILADEIRHTINAIPEDLISEDQRKGLQEGLGTSKIEHRRGVTSVAVGFNGYNDVKVGKFKATGQPNVMIARIVVKGVSWRDGKYDFVQYAIRNTETKVVNTMQEVFDKEVDKIMRG